MIATLKLFRFPLVFTAIADSAAGYLLRCPGAPDPLVLACLAAASAGLYMFGMAMNDIADRERDRTLAPGRMLPSGRLTPAQAVSRSLAVILVSAAAVIALPGRSLAPLAVWGGTLLAILAYDFVLKAPPVMGLIRALNFLIGVASVPPPENLYGLGSPLPGPYLALALTPFLYVTSLTFVSTLEEGLVKRWVVMFGALFMAGAAFLPEFLVRRELGKHPAGASWAASAVLACAVLARAAKAVDRKGVMFLVRDGVGGIILLEAVTLLSAGLVGPGLAIAGLVVPAALSVAGFKKLA